jgi:hypothetical protein
LSFFPLGGWHPCKQASKLVSRNTQVPTGAEAGAPQSTPSQGLAAMRIPCRAPSHACSRPRCEHQEYESAARSRPLSMRTTYVSRRASFPPRGLTRTRTSRGWMSRHGTRLVNGLKATPRRGAPLPRATLYGDVASVGSVGTARTDARPAPASAHRPRSSAGACLRTPGNPCTRIRYSTYAFAT